MEPDEKTLEQEIMELWKNRGFKVDRIEFVPIDVSYIGCGGNGRWTVEARRIKKSN